MAEPLLDAEFLSRLEYLYVFTRELFLGHVSAERLSRKFGVGIEFADYRTYSAGDDFRYIDWSTYARREELLIKLFTEEQASQIYCIIDASQSMSVGKPQKLLYAKKIAAALGYIGMSNMDPVTVLAFDDILREDDRHVQGRGQLRPFLTFLDAIEPSGATSMGNAISQFVQRYHSRGVVILLSDFLDRAGYEQALRLLHYHRFDLIPIQINDRDEVDPSYTGDLELVDSESGERRTVQITPELVASYKQSFTDHYAELARLCKVLWNGHLAVVTDTPFENLIFEVFRRSGFLK
jgi:uncharacterized protein (DUF58 family)